MGGRERSSREEWDSVRSDWQHGYVIENTATVRHMKEAFNLFQWSIIAAQSPMLLHSAAEITKLKEVLLRRVTISGCAAMRKGSHDRDATGRDRRRYNMMRSRIAMRATPFYCLMKVVSGYYDGTSCHNPPTPRRIWCEDTNRRCCCKAMCLESCVACRLRRRGAGHKSVS